MNRFNSTVLIAIGELVAVVVLWLSVGAGPAKAELVRAEWIATDGGNWNTPGAWGVIGQSGSFTFVPNNAGATTYAVYIDNDRTQQSHVSLNIDAVIDQLVISGQHFGDSLQVGQFNDLTIRGGPGTTDPGIVGDVSNGGLIFLAGRELILAAGAAGQTVRFFSNGILSLNSGIAQEARVTGTGTNPTLINDRDHKISGHGELGNDTLIIDNRGLVHADDDQKTLFIDPLNGSAMVNRSTGTLRASNGGIMELRDGTFTNSGLVEVGDKSRIEFTADATLTNNQNGVLIGGRWHVISTGNPASLTLPGNPRIVENRAAVILSGRLAEWFQIKSVAVNRGLMEARGGQKFRTEGNLLVDMGEDGPGTPSSGTGASAPGMQARSPGVSPEPILADPDGSEFTVVGTYTQLSGETFVEDAIFGADLGLSIEGGLLWGNGRIIGNTMVGPAATLRPGIEPDRMLDRQTGLLQVEGGLNLGGTLEIQLNGMVAGATYDQVEVAGGLTDLHGSLQVNLLAGFVPEPDDEFVILTSQSPVVGVFSNAPDTLVTRQGTFDVSYTGSQVILSNFDPVPEPSALVLLFAAALSGGSLTRKRRQALSF